MIALVGAIGVPAISGTDILGYDLAEAGVKIGLASLLVGLAGAVVGGVSLGVIRWAGSKLARREAMGLGDVKLMASTGLLLGPEGVLLALLLALVVGSVLGIVIWLVTRNRAIPFGPFLAAGSIAILFFHEEAARLILETYPTWLRSLF